nr:hypothetical transcript [Hymenolepis microstoma]
MEMETRSKNTTLCHAFPFSSVNLVQVERDEVFLCLTSGFPVSLSFRRFLLGLDIVSDESSPFPPEGHTGRMFTECIILFCEDASPGNRVRHTVQILQQLRV